jgi:hypothetical protein
MWFRARNVQTEFVLTDYSEREIFKPKLFWLIPSERNVQTKVILIDSKREKRSNQNYFDWFQARNVQTKVILIDCVWENCFDWFRARNVQTQNCFEWFRATSVPKFFFCMIASRNRSNPKQWLIASDRNIQSFLQRERVQKHCLLRFPLTALLPNLICPSVLWWPDRCPDTNLQ